MMILPAVAAGSGKGLVQKWHDALRGGLLKGDRGQIDNKCEQMRSKWLVDQVHGEDAGKSILCGGCAT
jgi:hypothetical protein